MITGATVPCKSQTNAELLTYFKQYIKLSEDQIAAIRKGEAVAKSLQSRVPAEIFVFGGVYINATPESYVKFAYDFARLRSTPGYLGVQKFSDPPVLSDFKGFTLSSDDVKDLKKCKPGDCMVQLPATRIDELRKSFDWSAPNPDKRLNDLLQKTALERLLAYQRGGNQVLGVYNDKDNPTQVAEQFKYMLSYAKALPKVLPGFYNYLLDYPSNKPANVEDTFYWSNVKFGLKPTLRLVQVVTMQGSNPKEPAYTIAEKQLYSSHYFQTALDMTYCISSDDPKRPGFYLIKVMGSEQAGLTGFKGSIVRGKAVGRSVSSLQKSLALIKSSLEQKK